MRNSAARCVAAELLRAEGQPGTLAAGAHADVAVLDGDPLQQIALRADRRETSSLHASNCHDVRPSR